MYHYLMVKTHNVTGLKYLCKTVRTDPMEYKGSGTYWKQHLKEHGDDISTEILLKTEDKEELKRTGIYYSILFDVVNNKQWANAVREEGAGGDTVSGKFWINNGITEKYHPKESPIPEGWVKGRGNNCKFKDKSFQKEMNTRNDRTKFRETMKQVWATGGFDKRDNSKCGVKGDLNPAKRSENRKKISIANGQAVTINGIYFNSIPDAMKYFNTSRWYIMKMVKK